MKVECSKYPEEKCQHCEDKQFMPCMQCKFNLYQNIGNWTDGSKDHFVAYANVATVDYINSIINPIKVEASSFTINPVINNCITADGVKIEALDDGSVLLNEKRVENLKDVEVALNVLIRSIISIVK